MKTKKEDIVWIASTDYDYYERYEQKGKNKILLSALKVGKDKFEAKILDLKTRKVKSKIFTTLERAIMWVDFGEIPKI